FFAPLIWLGQISYPIYLVHYPLVALINAHLPGGTGPVARAFILLLVSLPPVILASWLLHIAIEKPFIRFGKHHTGERIKPETGPVAGNAGLWAPVGANECWTSDIRPRTENLSGRLNQRN